MQKWSSYERRVRENFDRFMKELQIGDIISIYHGHELQFDHVKVVGKVTKDYPMPTGPKTTANKPTLHLILRHKYVEEAMDQPIDVEGSKTPWFDGPFIIHRDLEFYS